MLFLFKMVAVETTHIMRCGRRRRVSSDVTTESQASRQRTRASARACVSLLTTVEYVKTISMAASDCSDVAGGGAQRKKQTMTSEVTVDVFKRPNLELTFGMSLTLWVKLTLTDDGSGRRFARN